MRTRTTGRAGQRQARTPRSCALSQCAWLSGGVPAIWSPGDLPAALALRRGNLILSRPASDSREPSQQGLSNRPWRDLRP
jgi:hypothetical protein